jgi:zinc protease
MTRVLLSLLLLACACEPWRAVSPTVKDDFPIVLPKIRQAELPSGLLVVATRNSTAGLVRMSIVMNAGYGYDRVGREGTARFLATALHLLSSNTTHDARFGLVGATPTFSVTHMGLVATIETLPEDAAEGARVLAEFLAEATIPPGILERARAAQRAGLDAVGGSPSALAALALAQAYSPYAERFTGLGLGTPASLAAITAADLESHLALARNPYETAFVVTGLVDRSTVGAYATKAFAGWSTPRDAKPLGAARVARRTPPTIFIPMAGMTQALVVVGGMRPHSGEKVRLAHDVALGRVAGRWNHVLRTERRASYGVGDEVVNEVDAFAISVRVRVDRVRVALQALDEALDRTANEPHAEGTRWSEISRSAHIMYGAQDAGHIGADVATKFLQGDREFSLRRELDAVDELDDDAVMSAAIQYLHRDALQVIVVGDRDSVLPQLGGDVLLWTPAQIARGELPATSSRATP